MDLAQNYGIGAVAIALIVLVFKIWTDSTKRTDQVIEVLRQVAITQEKQSMATQQLSTNIVTNTEVTKQSAVIAKETADVAKQTAESVKGHADIMSEMVVKLLKTKK